MPTLIINEYILTENTALQRRTRPRYGGRKWDIHNQRVTWRGVHRPIMDLQYQRLTSQIRDCYREENSFFELFLKNKSLTKFFKVSSIITSSKNKPLLEDKKKFDTQNEANLHGILCHINREDIVVQNSHRKWKKNPTIRGEWEETIRRVTQAQATGDR